MTAERCSIPRCRGTASLYYTTDLEGPTVIPVCEHHWNRHCDDADPFTLRSKRKSAPVASPQPPESTIPPSSVPTPQPPRDRGTRGL